MLVYIARHGIAYQALDGDDYGRKLTAEGRAALEELGKGLMEENRQVELILHSPLVRTTETAEVLAPFVGDPERLPVSGLCPGATPDKLISELEGVRNFTAVLVVGHAPDVTFWVYRLLKDRPSSPPRFMPGNLVGVELGEEQLEHSGKLVLTA